jgi:poly(hydroxyalkanoate) granule-associated protein
MARRLKSKPILDTKSIAAKAITESAQQIWQAGLGAFARAQQEGGKFFEQLVQQGKKLESTTRQAAETAMKTVKKQAAESVDEATGRWDKLEQVFEERVSRSLNKLGVLTAKDVDQLTRKVADLNDSVRALMAKQGVRAKKAPARKPSAKPAAKRPARRKAAK